MCAKAIVDVALHRPVDIDLVWVGEILRLAVCADEAAEDLIAGLDVDFATVVVDGQMGGGKAVGAKCAAETDTFHCVVEKLLIRLGAGGLCKLVDSWKMLRVIKVVVDQLGELPQMSLTAFRQFVPELTT